MATPDGYKIFWGLTKDSVDGIYPDRSKPFYDSPFIVTSGVLSVTGGVASFPLPVDFWHDSFVHVHFRVAAYKDGQDGVKSRPISVYTFVKEMNVGLQSFSLPLNDGHEHAAKTVGQSIGATVVYIYDKTQGKFVSTITSLSAPGPAITKQTGTFVNIPSVNVGQKAWRGRVWQS